MRRTTPLGILLVAVLVSACALPGVALAATNADLYAHQRAADEARKKAAAEQKLADALLAQTRKLESEIQVIAGEVTALEGEIGTASERRARLEQEIGLLRGSIDLKQQQIESVKQDYEVQTDALAARVDATYRSGEWVFIDWLLSAESIPDLLDRTAMVQRIMENDEEIADGLESDRIVLERAEQELARTLDEVSTKRAEVKAEEDRLEGLQSIRNSKLKAEQSAKNQKTALLAETKENIARLRAIAAAEDRESARIAAMLKGGSSHGSGRYAGSMAWPCPGYTRVSSQFGMRYHPILHYNRMHAGIDVSAPSGATLVAVGSGVVVSAGVSGGYGKCVMIDHGDGLVSVYAHMSRISVSKGQKLVTGQSIGAVGSTGLSTGPHLHFEIRVNGNPVNPLGGYI
ncbi:MAG: peptidoglycan DD-metalloendopeptidase family protein [Coriobacteriia bacterium]|nr:peptidoglycan DD-metalloendopeptidase family protein [Coriobacteriia bacterium]